MTTKHTPGPLHLSRTSRDRMKAFDEAGNMVVSTDYSQHSTAQAIADIGRVVACWNACAGHEDPEDMAREAYLFRRNTAPTLLRDPDNEKRSLGWIVRTTRGTLYLAGDGDGGWKWTDEARTAVDALRGEHA